MYSMLQSCVKISSDDIFQLVWSILWNTYFREHPKEWAMKSNDLLPNGCLCLNTTGLAPKSKAFLQGVWIIDLALKWQYSHVELRTW